MEPDTDRSDGRDESSSITEEKDRLKGYRENIVGNINIVYMGLLSLIGGVEF